MKFQNEETSRFNEGAGKGRNSTRENLFNIIQRQPGLHKSELARISGFSWGTVTHHVRMLEQEGLVCTAYVGRRLHIVAADSGVASSKGLLLAPLALDLVRLLAGVPGGLGPTEIARRLGSTRKQVCRVAAILEGAGLLERDGAYHPRLRLLPEAQNAVAALGRLDEAKHDNVGRFA